MASPDGANDARQLEGQGAANLDKKPEEVHEDIFQNSSKTFSPGLNSQAVLEKIQQAGSEIRGLIGYDLTAALDVSDRVNAAIIHEAENINHSGLDSLVTGLGMPATQLRQITLDSAEADDPESQPGGMANGSLTVQPLATRSARYSNNGAGQPMLSQILEHTVTSQENTLVSRSQELATQARASDSESSEMASLTESTGSAPLEALAAIGRLGRGELFRSKSPFTSGGQIDNRTDDAEDGEDNHNHLQTAESFTSVDTSSSSYSSGEEETWPDEAYQTENRQSLNGMEPSSASGSEVHRRSLDGSTNVPDPHSSARVANVGERGDSNSPRRPESRNTSFVGLSTLEPILEESEVEVVADLKSPKPDNNDIPSNTKLPHDISQVADSLSPSPDGVFVSFNTVHWNLSAQL